MFEIGDIVEIKKGESDRVYDTYEAMAVLMNVYNWRKYKSPLYGTKYKVMSEYKRGGTGRLIYIESMDGNRYGYIMDIVALKFAKQKDFLEEELFYV